MTEDWLTYRHWTVAVRATQPQLQTRNCDLEILVHCVGFDPASSVSPDTRRNLRLSWPESILRSRPVRQTEFTFGRLAARHALAAIAPELKDANVGIGTKREPLWPDSIGGSIAHARSGGSAEGPGVAVAIAEPLDRLAFLGIDLEATALGDAQRALRSVAIAPSELAVLEQGASGDHQSDLHALTTWTFMAKECLFKAAYPSVRRYFGFSSALLVEYEPRSDAERLCCRLGLALTEDLSAAFPRGSRWWIDVWPLRGTSLSLAVLAG